MLDRAVICAYNERKKEREQAMFGRKKQPVRTFDRENLEPVIRSSICTGEQEAGFRDRRTGAFRGVMLIRSDRDLADFCREWGVENPRRIY